MTFGSDLVLLPGSVSEFEIDSLLPGEFDLALSGAGVQEVEFGGSLNLFFRPGFNMTGTVTLFDFETFTGNFSAVNATGLAPGYSAFFDASNGTLSLVPEGGTLTFLGLAAVLLAGMRVLRLRNRCG